MGFAHLSVHAVSDRPPDLMFTWQRAAMQAASHALAVLATKATVSIESERWLHFFV
jgi:hypothetical protein